MGKDRAYGTGLINLYPVRRGQLMEQRAVQRYSHTMGTQKTIRQTNFFCIYLFYKFCQQQEQIQQEREKIFPQMHHMYQKLYKFQWLNYQIQSISFRGHYRIFLASPLTMLGFWWTMDMTAKSSFFIGKSQILSSGAS